MNTDFASRLSASALHWCSAYGYNINDPVVLGRQLAADDRGKRYTIPAPTLADRRALVEAWLESPDLTDADVDAVMSGYEGDAE
jgi:hypothetical protein